MPDRTLVEPTVMRFAAECTLVTRPASRSDRIFPGLKNLSDAQYQQFHRDLASALGRAGFAIDLPFQAVRDCVTWTDVCSVVMSDVV